MTTKIEQLNSEAAVTDMINKLHKRGATLQMDIHKMLVGICARWAASGDVRPVAGHINHLLSKDQLGGVRKNAIRAWVETYMGLRIADAGDNKGNFYAPVELDKSGKHMDLKMLANNRWFEFKPEPEYRPIDDPMKMITQMLAKMQKDIDKLGEESKVDPALLAKAKAAFTPEVLH